MTMLRAFFGLRGAVSELEPEAPGAIRAMFLGIIPDELGAQGAAMAEAFDPSVLAILTALYGAAFHQGYSKAFEHAAENRNLHAQLRSQDNG